MLVLFETSVGYAIFKVEGRVSRWRGKAGVGPAGGGQTPGEGDAAQGRRGALSAPCSERKGQALGAGGACSGEHVASLCGAQGSG